MSVYSSPSGRTVKFARATAFHAALQNRVMEYLAQRGSLPSHRRYVQIKTLVIAGWVLTSYGLLVFFASAWWQVLPLAGSLALALAGVGFNVHHDASHGSYSRRPRVNRAMAKSLELMGGSSIVWKWKHNVLHHTCPNVTGVDPDTALWPYARNAKTQPLYAIHRFQHLYMWVLYGFVTLRWYAGDFRFLLTGRIGAHRVQRPRGSDLFAFIGWKLVFLGWTVLIPLTRHSAVEVVSVWMLCAYILGLTLAVTFQLAHSVEEVEFPVPSTGTHRIETEWAVHQVRTTMNFATSNRWLSWYLGGLNFQVEHHLFPRISHVHYPALSTIVRTVCADFGIRYLVHETLLDAIGSHFRWLRRLGRATSPTVECRPRSLDERGPACLC